MPENKSFMPEIKPSIDIEKTRETISQMLGFVGSMATDIIKSDIKDMLKKDMRKEIDGYILCVSRVVKHDLAWICIENAFNESGEPVPKKYMFLFGK